MSLHDLCRRGQLSQVESLLERGADVNAILHGETPLHVACSSGHPNIVRLLIRYGATVGHKAIEATKRGNKLRSTPLRYIAIMESLTSLEDRCQRSTGSDPEQSSPLRA